MNLSPNNRPDDLSRAKELLRGRFGPRPAAYVRSFGCQQNAADAERIEGLLLELGCALCKAPQEADLIVFNTCAVRHSAENRVLGQVGALKGLKARKPDLLIVLCGCMTQRPQMADRIRDHYPHVDVVAGTGAIGRLPALLRERLCSGKSAVERDRPPGGYEDLPAHQSDPVKAWLPIMQGCDNFCSYCIVPYVRGREASRDPGEVERELDRRLSLGAKEVTLLGQNVNSYGKGLDIDFSGLLRRLDQREGEWRLRFMTSHPKDCTQELLETVAQSRHLCRHIHLPVQSGSDRILEAMNRGYTAGHYRALIAYARAAIPGVTFSSDILVGFPGEREEDFLQTLELVRELRCNALFTFLYSRREGTAAADLPDPVAAQDKSAWFRRLLTVQQEICAEENQNQVGRTLRVLIDSPGRTRSGMVAGRTEGNVIVELPGGEERIGRFADVRIDKAMSWAMTGEIAE